MPCGPGPGLLLDPPPAVSGNGRSACRVDSLGQEGVMRAGLDRARLPGPRTAPLSAASLCLVTFCRTLDQMLWELQQLLFLFAKTQ